MNYGKTREENSIKILVLAIKLWHKGTKNIKEIWNVKLLYCKDLIPNLNIGEKMLRTSIFVQYNQ